MNPHIKRAAAQFRNNVTFARAIGRSPQFVSQLLSGDRPVPGDLCPTIERATRENREASGEGEIVTCEQLRPDIDWQVVRENPPVEATEADPSAAEAGEGASQPEGQAHA
jgi:DNA-binding transcriptional regulator YdaS (Cro superfamily)